MSLVQVDLTSELERAADPGEFVVQCLERGKTWLAEALQHGDLDALVNARGYAETLRVATAQKQLGHDAELSAAELVRRAERTIGQAIRAGQETGAIRRKGEGGGPRAFVDPARDENRMSPSDYLPGAQERVEAYLLAETPDDEFEEALGEAKAEGNLSRANIVRKVKPKTTAQRIRRASENNPADDGPRNLPLKERADQIRALAARNLTSPQIADEIRITAQTVRDIARRCEFSIPADAVFGGKFRKVDPNNVLDSIIEAATPEPVAVALIAYSELDRGRLDEWVSSLEIALKSLQTIKRNLSKELTRDQ